MRLVTFGCSNTAGEGLDDAITTGNPGQPDRPSMFAWPQLLADQMNLENINMAQGGSSNKQITWTIQNFDFQKDDVVVIMWSMPNRWCLITDNRNTDNLPKLNKIGPWKVRKKIKFAKTTSDYYYKHLYNEFDSLVDTYTRIDYVSNMLNNLSIKNFHAMCRDDEFPDWKYSEKILRKNQFKWQTTEFLQTTIDNSTIDIAPDDDHPGYASHRLIAEKIHKEIEDRV